MNVKPLDFIVIGVSKAGTTTLFQHLRHHPQIYIPPSKEVPFFSQDEWFERGWEWFVKENFARAPLDACWGTITPRYMIDLRAVERIHNAMPKVKLIAILRNPIDRTFSYYRMRVRKGSENQDFETLARDQLNPESAAEARTLPWHPETTSLCYLVRSEYGRILRQYLSYFPPEQLKVLFIDDLKERPQFVLDSIVTCLGLEPGYSPPDLNERYHAGGTRQKIPWLIPAARKITPAKRLWKTLSSDRRRAIVFWFSTQVNVVSQEAPELPSDLRRQLVEFYKPDVRELETLIGRTVPWPEYHAES